MSRGLTWLWALYIGTLPFHLVWTLLGLNTKLQPPELIFLALVLVAIVVYRRGEVRARLGASTSRWSCGASPTSLRSR